MQNEERMEREGVKGLWKALREGKQLVEVEERLASREEEGERREGEEREVE